MLRISSPLFFLTANAKHFTIILSGKISILLNGNLVMSSYGIQSDDDINCLMLGSKWDMKSVLKE